MSSGGSGTPSRLPSGPSGRGIQYSRGGPNVRPGPNNPMAIGNLVNPAEGRGNQVQYQVQYQAPRVPQPGNQVPPQRGGQSSRGLQRGTQQPAPLHRGYEPLVDARQDNRGRGGGRASSRSRTPSLSRSASDPEQADQRERREFRPPFTREESDFIWYHRVDLGWDWAEVGTAFNMQFPHRSREGFTGLQCRHYRHLSAHNVPAPRQWDRSVPQRQYGLRAQTGRWYAWMR